MALPPKFVFDRSFDNGPMAERVPEPSVLAPEPSSGPQWTAADIEMARSEGYRQGLMAGSQSSKEALEHHLASVLEGIHRAFLDVTQALDQQAQQASHAVRRVIEKLFPVFTESLAFQEITTLIETHFLKASTETKAVVTVSPNLLDALSQYLARYPKFKDMTLQADPAMFQGDCTVTWAWGGVERYSKKAMDELFASMEPLLPMPLESELAKTSTRRSNSVAKQVPTVRHQNDDGVEGNPHED